MSNILYAPILKARPAEFRALTHLDDAKKQVILPIIELVLPNQTGAFDRENKPDPTEALRERVEKFRSKTSKTVVNEIEASWGKRDIAIDFSLLHNGEDSDKFRKDMMSLILNDAQSRNLSVIPVINSYDDPEIIAVAASRTENGLCIRITPSQISSDSKISELNNKITSLITTLSLNKRQLDVLVDVKDELDIYENCSNMAEGIELIKNCRRYILSAGSFPADVSAFKIEDLNLAPRIEWTKWKTLKVGKTPIFSDYSIRNPIFSEQAQIASTTIKYALEDKWLIMRGKRHEYDLYLLNAKLLASSKYYYGPAFSYGDRYIQEKAEHCELYLKNKKIKGTGNNTDWIAVGINHHLTVTADLLSN